jgi:Zn-dependent protease with chaperone function
VFYLLGGALSLAVLFFLISIGTLLQTAVFRAASPRLRRIDRCRLPRLLFLIHLAPFLVAFGVVLGFVLPAFVALEPPSTGEGLNPMLIIGAVLGAGILLNILGRLACMWIATARQESRWLEQAEPLLTHDHAASVFVLPTAAPLMAVTGVLRPRVFVSQPIISALNQHELAAALSHEFAHIRERDNLKQLLLRITQSPRWFSTALHRKTSHLEQWINASEVLADRTAIAGGTSPYDLASALVKVARLSAGATALPPIAASHLVPDCTDSAVASRVLQIREILADPAAGKTAPRPKRNAIAMKWLLAASAAALYLFSLNLLLPRVHEALEWLVR